MKVIQHLSPKCSKTIQTLQKNIEKIYNSETLTLLDEPQNTLEEEKNSTKTLQIIKEQQDLTKITIKDNASLIAKKLGLKNNKTVDRKILNTALLNLKQIRRLAIKEKIERPLKLKTKLTEKDLKNLKTLKKIIKKHTKQS
ncbi:MAG: hypothetical protein E7005_01920 [Alphaproteobacteria bacterium]|nr:hypothetical protein [Alphaproteobacteria bacterium]